MHITSNIIHIFLMLRSFSGKFSDFCQQPPISGSIELAPESPGPSMWFHVTDTIENFHE